MNKRQRTIILDEILNEILGQYVKIRCVNGIVAEGTVTKINSLGIKIINNNETVFLPFYNIIYIQYRIKPEKNDKLK